MIKKISGREHVASLPEGETIVSMVNHNGKVLVASNKNIYFLNEKTQLEKILFSSEDQGEEK